MNRLSPNIENYKRIPFDFGGADGGAVAVDNFVDKVNTLFRSDEIRLYRNADAVELWLREVSMDDFDDRLGKISGSGEGFDKMTLCLEEHVKGIRSYGLKGKKRLYVGYNKERKVASRVAKEQKRGKHFYANDHGFSPEVNALPDSFRNAVLCEDSEKALKQLPDNCVDAVFTSPPYNFGLDYDNSGDDAVDWHAYFEKLFRVFDECIRVLKYGGRLIVNIQPLYSDYIPSHHVISNYLMHRKMIWKGEILWEKNNYNCKYTSWGSWKSPSSPYLKYTWEFLEVFCKGDLKKAGAPANADIDADSFKKWVLAKWSIAPERNMKKYDHPAMFPEELVERALLLFTFKHDIILDPFNGAGTTCAVAKNLDRDYLGIDVSKEYYQVAKKRVKQPGGTKRLL